MKMITTILPEKCWIYSKHQYVLKGISLPQLPSVDLEYEAILKSNGIPYRKVKRLSLWHGNDQKEVYEYWNPDVGLNERDLSLPLYAIVSGSYRYCEKKYSEKVPTDETIEAAHKTEAVVKAAIDEYIQILREVDYYNFAKEKLAGEVSTVCISSTTPYSSVYNISMNHHNFKILRVPSRIYLSDYVAIFDMNKIAANSCITLHVPSRLAGFVIGKGGSRI